MANIVMGIGGGGNDGVVRVDVRCNLIEDVSEYS